MGRKPNVGLGPGVKNPNLPKPPTGPVGGVIGGGFVPLLPDTGSGPRPIGPRPMPYPEIGRPVVPPENKVPVGSIIGGIGVGRIPLPIVRPPTQPIEETRPGNDGSDPKYAPGYGGAIGYTGPITHQFLDRDGDGIDDRKQKGPGIDPFTGKPDDRLLDRIKRKEEERREREERKRYVEEKRKTDPMYGIKPPKEDRVKSTPRSRLDRKQIDKSPEARQKFLDSLTREELEQRSHQDPVRGSRVRPVKYIDENLVTDRRTRDFNPNLKSFDAKQYLANYGDLQKAFGDDEAKARQHFIDYGMKEGRVDTAGGGTLKAETRDRRAKTFKAKSRAAAAKRREGFLRGEEGATFDAKQYLANYADLQKAFGSDEEKARQHYRQYGAKEGRVDTRM